VIASRQRLQGLIKGPWLGILAAFGLFLLSRPYQGVRHDARLYVADAMAKAGWGDIGKDLMFVNDGQFGFSLYTPMLSKLIQGLGLQAGTLAIVVVTLLLWFAAATFLVRRLLADRPPAVRWAATSTSNGWPFRPTAAAPRAAASCASSRTSRRT